jgi:hypothetical protein
VMSKFKKKGIVFTGIQLISAKQHNWSCGATILIVRLSY